MDEEIDSLREELAELRAQKDGAYAERNKLVAALARFSGELAADVYLARHEGPDWEDDWRTILVFETPAGQLTWHFHDSERELLRGIPEGAGYRWDGHDTPTKYARLAAWAREIEARE